MHKKIVDLNTQVQQARELFDEGRVVPSQWVRDEVLRSWLRCIGNRKSKRLKRIIKGIKKRKNKEDNKKQKKYEMQRR